MSDYYSSVLAQGQVVVTEDFQKWEQRRKMPNVLGLALQNQEISIPNAQSLRVSELRTVDVNFFTKKSAGSATTKTAVHTGTYGDSSKINVVYVQHVETFSMPYKISQNNKMTYQNIFNNLYSESWKNLRTRHDSSGLAFLATNKCQLSDVDASIVSAIGASGAGFWNGTNHALEISQTDKVRFMQKAKAFMAGRYFTGAFDVVADLQSASEFEYLMYQGSGNYANTSFQFGDLGIYATQDVIDSAYTQGSVFMMPKGSFAGLNWNDPLNLNWAGTGNAKNNVGFLTTEIDPFGSGAVADISVYTTRLDSHANASGGSLQDFTDQYEIALTIGYVTAPLTSAGDSVIHEIVQSV